MSRHRSLLGALAFRDYHVAARSREPWCSEMFTLPLALGNLGVENCLRHRSLLGALVLRACHVTVCCWEPWCEELFALPIAILFGVSGPSWGFFWGPFGLSWGPLGPSWGPFGPYGGLLEAFGHLGALLGASCGLLGSLLGLSWGSLGAVLGPSRGPLGALLCLLGAVLGSSGLASQYGPVASPVAGPAWGERPAQGAPPPPLACGFPFLPGLPAYGGRPPSQSRFSSPLVAGSPRPPRVVNGKTRREAFGRFWFPGAFNGPRDRHKTIRNEGLVPGKVSRHPGVHVVNKITASGFWG